MSAGTESDPKVEIGHVLMMDVVEYSTLLNTEQSRIMSELKRIARKTARFQQAEAEGKLVCVPTGDGGGCSCFLTIPKQRSNALWRSAPQ
jgi:hypothetical protein